MELIAEDRVEDVLLSCVGNEFSGKDLGIAYNVFSTRLRFRG